MVYVLVKKSFGNKWIQYYFELTENWKKTYVYFLQLLKLYLSFEFL